MDTDQIDPIGDEIARRWRPFVEALAILEELIIAENNRKAAENAKEN